MNAVNRWIADLIEMAGSAEPSKVSAALIHSKAWSALAEGALGELAFDAAKEAGSRGWLWIEEPTERSTPKKMALRALCLGDIDELARWIGKLDPMQASHAMEVAFSDPRVDDEQAWRAVVSTWPAILEASAPLRRSCEDWAPLAHLASGAGIGQARGVARVFSLAMGALDEKGGGFAEAWVKAACSRGASVDACARALGLHAMECGERGQEWLLAARLALAKGSGDFVDAQEDPRQACASGLYWSAWRSLASPEPKGWSLWLKSYGLAVKSQTVGARRVAGCAALGESLEAYRQDGAPWSQEQREDSFASFVGLARLHLESWPRGASESQNIQAKYHKAMIELALSEWALELGEPQEGWSKRTRDLALFSVELAAKFEKSRLEASSHKTDGWRNETPPRRL